MSGDSGRLRLDRMLVARGLVATRARAQVLIAEGKVRSDGRVLTRPSQPIDGDQPLEVASDPAAAWVSRGALKLVHGLDHFALDPKGSVALDIGASTGGFCQVLLARGAARVYGVDVGHGQIAPELRDEPRLILLERQNARDLSRSEIPEAIDFLTCDASFIGLRTVLAASLALSGPTARLVALIKPQFEVGPAGVGRGGVVRDEALQVGACERIARWLEDNIGWTVLGVTESPIRGGDGNREFLLGARR